jgi:hypothetical protein
MGGSNDPSNLVLLTIEQHADAHRVLYEQDGRWQDYVAWKTLSGQMSRAEAIKLAQRNGDKSWTKTPEGQEALKSRWIKRKARGDRPWNKGLTKETSPSLQQSSQRNLKYRKQNRLSNIGDIVRGTKFTTAHRSALASSAKQRTKKICPHCMKEVIPQMFARWHGDKCRALLVTLSRSCV